MISPSNPRKRQSRDWDTLQTPESSQHSKRHKSTTSPQLPSPSRFWRGLSEIYLDKSALKEHDRTCNTARRSSCFAGYSQKATSVDEILQSYSAQDRKKLIRFARTGGPDMSDARDRIPFVRPTRGPRSRRSASRQKPTPVPSEQASTKSGSTRLSGTYSPNFQQHLVDHGVLHANYIYPDGQSPPLPLNWTAINERLAAPRRSLSPSRLSDDEFRRFQVADGGAFKEKQVCEMVIPLIEGRIANEQCRSGGIVFRNLDPLTDGTIKQGNPDIYEGARPEQLLPQVRDELKAMIMPTTQENLPMCPNFFVAVKGPEGSLAIAMRQACYDGALGARGIHSLRTYGEEQASAGNSAHTITCIYYGGMLKIYATSRADSQQPRTRPEYHMHQMGAWSMTGDLQTFQRGATAYRNARDWAEEQRNEAISHANAIARARSSDSAGRTAAATEQETNATPFVDESSSPHSARYTTPPTEQDISADSLGETQLAGTETGKRTRQQLSSSSPVQQQKKKRDHDRGEHTASVSTNISFQFEQYDLNRQGSDGSEDLSEHEEHDAARRPTGT